MSLLKLFAENDKQRLNKTIHEMWQLKNDFKIQLKWKFLTLFDRMELLNISFEHTYKNYRVLNIQINVTLSSKWETNFFRFFFSFSDLKQSFETKIILISQLWIIRIGLIKDSFFLINCPVMLTFSARAQKMTGILWVN